MQAWQSALLSIDNIEADVQQVQTLCQYPIFAIIVVINKSLLMESELSSLANIKEQIAQWVEEQSQTPAGWHAVDVDNYDNSDNDFINTVLSEAQIDGVADGLTEVEVLRYVLFPNSIEMRTTPISEDKRTAIAHVIDEQLTHYLQQTLQIDTQTDSFDCHIFPVRDLLQVHKVACFDMDSTLIEQEVIVELAKVAGIGDKVNEITESAMRGEIDFSESFAQRLHLLDAMSAEVLDDISDSLTLSAGAKSTLAILNAMGYHTVLLSGGFAYFAERIAGKLQLNEYHANYLKIEEGKVIGEVSPPIVDGQRKAELVQHIAKQQGVDLAEVICIGDGANDLPMMAVANLGFAYHAKPIVQAKANVAINCTGLEGVLYALGYGNLGYGKLSHGKLQ